MKKKLLLFLFAAVSLIAGACGAKTEAGFFDFGDIGFLDEMDVLMAMKDYVANGGYRQ